MNKKAQGIIKEIQKEIQAYKKAHMNDLLKEIEYNQDRVSSLGRKVAYLKVGSSK